METCTNCERKIGNLETAYVYKQAVICAECERLLNKIGSESEAPGSLPQFENSPAWVKSSAKKKTVADYYPKKKKHPHGAAINAVAIVAFLFGWAINYNGGDPLGSVLCAAAWIACLIWYYTTKP